MNVAIVHELLTMNGGAERIAGIFADLFPHAPVYTFLYDERLLGNRFPRHRIRTSTLQRMPRLLHRAPRALQSRLFNHHLYLPFFPRAAEAWDFSAFDLVLSSSSAFAHGILTNGAPKHLCYVHSPARYLWDRFHDVARQTDAGMVGRCKRAWFERTAHRLRMWDSEAAARPDVLLAASMEVERRIRRYWDRSSTVLHPPVANGWFQEPLAAQPRSGFLIVSTLARYKRIDLAIEAANRLRVPLTIAGDGPDARRLQALAGPQVRFTGRRNEEELRSLYASHAALIVPGEEDFCLTAVEAMASGTPVIAFAGGGVLETVTEGTTGTFFGEPTATALADALQRFSADAYDPVACRNAALPFQEDAFRKNILREIDALMTRSL